MVNNKKGAESFTVILWIIVGVIVVGLFIYAYYQGFLPVLGGAKNLPKQMEIAIQACNALGNTPLEYSYCLQARETSDSNKRVTCGYLAEQKLLKETQECTFENQPLTAQAAGEKICREAYAEDLDFNSNGKISINGVMCSSVYEK